MKTATVRQLRNEYLKVLNWVSRGEEVEVTRRGQVVARIVPPIPTPAAVNWAESAAFNHPPLSRVLSAEEVAAVLAENQE